MQTSSSVIFRLAFGFFVHQRQLNSAATSSALNFNPNSQSEQNKAPEFRARTSPSTIMEVDSNPGPTMRPITSELNVLTRSDGSAIITQGKPHWSQVSVRFLKFSRFLCFRWIVLYCFCERTRGGQLSESRHQQSLRRSYLSAEKRTARRQRALQRKTGEKSL